MRRHYLTFGAYLLTTATVFANDPTNNSDCQYSDLQPQQVDFDDTQKRLHPTNGLTITSNAKIRSILIESRDIFDLSDPEENNWLTRSMNALHIETRKRAIESQLLFKPGNTFNSELISETERLLRNQSYFYDASIGPYRVCGTEVDIAVVTRDMWTLTPNISFSRSGGENKSTLGITDDNFLGMGKKVFFNREENEDRTGYRIGYSDPNLFKSRWQTTLIYADTDDGEATTFALQRPFYKIGAEWSFGFDYRDHTLVKNRYYRGEKISEFQEYAQSYGLFSGVSLSVEGNVEKRLLFGYHYQELRFSPEANSPAPAPFPENRIVSYPWVGFNYLNNTFFRAININKIQQVEDLRDGKLITLRLGWSDKKWEADENRLILNNRFQDTLIASERQYAVVSLTQKGYWNEEKRRPENLNYQLHWQHYISGKQKRHNWYARLLLTRVSHLTPDKELSLGGDSGLRGYPLRYQIGDRRYLFTLERRYYSNWYPFNFFRVGGVLFFDAGRAWFANQDNGFNGGPLSNVGLGIRLASSRLQVAKVLQFDIAYPLQTEGDDSLSDVEVLIRGAVSF